MNKLEQAMEDHKQGKWQEADSVYQEILIEEPENADVMYILATSQLSQNKLEEALTTIEKAIEVEANAPAFNQLKGSILARMGKIEEALKELEKAVKRNPNLYQAHIVIGHLNYTKGNRKEAEQSFKMAEKANAENPEAQVNLARLLMDEGEVQEAINKLRIVEKQHPEQASVKMMMGQAFIENGAYNFAENYFQKVLAMHPDYDLAGLYLGITKLHTGDLENAEKLITSFNQQYQNTREGIAALGLLMYKKNQTRLAIGYLKNAIGMGLSPLSWRAAYVESVARIGDFQPAIDFYKNLETRFDNKAAKFRLGELYELQGKSSKAKKQYKKIEQSDSKHTAALLGLARVYLKEEKAEKAENKCNAILNKFQKHAEATLLLLTSLLFQDKQSQALEVLESINYDDYVDEYKKTFRLQHGLILDKQQKYDEAMTVFCDEKKQEQRQTPKLTIINEQELKKIQAFDSKIDDDRPEPVFIIGAQSTAINDFVLWLNQQGVLVLNDRLLTLGRPDILYSYIEIDKLEDFDDDMVRLERKLYHQKVKVFMAGNEPKDLLVDAMFINPLQVALIKKFFPKAEIILLSRDTPDIWLNQKIYGKEPIDSKDWNETKNQIISMGLKLTQVDIDKWFENDEKTMKLLSGIFNKELKHDEKEQRNYWRKTHFDKGHWKNYKNYLGK